MKQLVLDTHALVWYLEDNPNLTSTPKKEIENLSNRIIISMMVLLEIKYLHKKKRFKVAPETVYENLENNPRCIFYPIDWDIVTELPLDLSIHDAVIVATARIFEKFHSSAGEVHVLTKDKEIRDSGMVKTIW